MANKEKRLHVGLYVTCLVDLYRPTIGFSVLALLEQAGCRVSVPQAQTCCGQPAFNAGDRQATKEFARRVITHFSEFEYVVVPSGSCASMICKYYPDLFKDDEKMLMQSKALAQKTYELTTFLVDICHMDQARMRQYEKGTETKITYHDSCSGLRDLQIKHQPRRLLQNRGYTHLTEMSSAEECCGFGGAFCVKYPEISNKMVSEKALDIEKTGAELLVAGDLGCLLNMAGKLKRIGSYVQVRHIAEILTDEGLKYPAIGEAVTDASNNP